MELDNIIEVLINRVPKALRQSRHRYKQSHIDLIYISKLLSINTQSTTYISEKPDIGQIALLGGSYLFQYPAAL